MTNKPMTTQSEQDELTYGFDSASPNGDMTALTIRLGTRVYTYVGEEADAIMQLIHQRELSLLAEVEKRVIGVNEPEDVEDCKWGHDFNAGNRNELRFSQRQTLQAMREERL